MIMKYFKIILIACICALTTVSCEKSRYPEFENSANAQFIRDLGVVTANPATNTTFNTATLNKSNPTLADKFTLKIIETGNVSSVKVLVDYKKGSTTLTTQYKEITSWPITGSVSLNDLIALFASQGVTSASVTAGDKFVFRTVITLKSGTVVSEQAAVFSALPYTITLTYTVAN